MISTRGIVLISLSIAVAAGMLLVACADDVKSCNATDPKLGDLVCTESRSMELLEAACPFIGAPIEPGACPPGVGCCLLNDGTSYESRVCSYTDPDGSAATCARNDGSFVRD